MKFDDKKKQSIILYLLEKIDQGDASITKSVAEAFGVNQATANGYLKELLDQGVIKKIKRGTYELVGKEASYLLQRKDGDLDSDTYAYDACLEQHLKYLSSNVQEIWNYTFSEMINNVMDHSQAELAKIVVYQDYLKTRVLIADNGIGIFNKIKDYFNFPSIDETICELFKGKLTTDSENHSGEGIFFSSKMMDTFFIISSGKIFTNNIYDNSMLIDVLEATVNGTVVIMELSNYSHKTTMEIFDLYADVDGGFTKTTIPMKNIFDTSPVSRSQAKRVCNRLEKFQEVIIDFAGVTWMGQGFAHQLFIVFAKKHENIKLIPINMNEDITKMYQHVVVTKG